jgi:hypothetical protein
MRLARHRRGQSPARLQRDRRLAPEASVDGSIRLSWRFGEESVDTQDFNSPSDYSCAQVLTFTMRLVLV